MAQKRMIDKKISVSEDVASLTTDAQLLFTWMIPHADDAGLLPYSARSIKALVVPMKDWRVEDIGIHLETIREAKLIDLFEWEGDKFWHITNFHNHQTLKRDRNPQCIAKNLTSWNQLESIWKTLETQGVEERKKGAKGIAVYENAKKQILNKVSRT